MPTIAENLQSIGERIFDAAHRSGRSAKEIRLVAVTKYSQPSDGVIDALLEAGCHDLGEARPQSLVEKAERFQSFPDGIRWHLIGSLQRNKIRRLLPICSMIHSVDSLRLLDAIDRIAEEDNLPNVPPLLLEINISAEETKHGFEPEELPAVLEYAAKFPRLRIAGLMGMSGLRSDDSQKRREFQTLYRLAELHGLRELSMGMSDDFEIAVEEGATLLRLGSVLYPDGVTVPG